MMEEFKLFDINSYKLSWRYAQEAKHLLIYSIKHFQLNRLALSCFFAASEVNCVVFLLVAAQGNVMNRPIHPKCQYDNFDYSICFYWLSHAWSNDWIFKCLKHVHEFLLLCKMWILCFLTEVKKYWGIVLVCSDSITHTKNSTRGPQWPSVSKIKV